MLKIRKSKNGFTLVELLLVMAIIGILASVITVGRGSSRNKARVTSALKTADSVLAEAAECYLKNGVLSAWTTTNGGGGKICSLGSGGDWPELVKKCDYSALGITTFNIACNKTSSKPLGDVIQCDVSKARCIKP
jgi:prepilin-type N-terminal cleavage/methylation domain-containing protein